MRRRGNSQPLLRRAARTPLFRLLDRRVGKSDDVEDRQAGGDIHFNLDYEPIESKDRTGLNVPDTTASENYLLVSHRMVWS